VAEPGACSYQSFDGFKIDLKATASISGKFISPDARPIREPFPKICQLKSTEKETLDSCDFIYESVKPDGSFSFDGLREGRYTILVGEDFPTGLEPFRRHYYPGVNDFSQAKAIEIRQGEKKRGLQFDLPPTLRTKLIRGQIVTSDGTPARLRDGDARFFYFSAYNIRTGRDPDLLVSHSYRLGWGEGKKGPEIEMFKTSPDGTFEAELFEGFTYILRAESGQEFNGYRCGFALINVVTNIKEPVRIALDRERPCDATKFVRELDTGRKQ
jgi:hypothetical protein